jgi:hypothetical protein
MRECFYSFSFPLEEEDFSSFFLSLWIKEDGSGFDFL